jgi:ribonuclease BN (tRNA processing enzyme)
MNIKVLGNGGALNNGLAYNAFVINGRLLCETPPDIMRSIHIHLTDLSFIDTIYISHLHGDHTFGLPFLILSAFKLHVGSEKPLSFTIIGPEGLEKTAEHLVISAFTARHPCLTWMKEFCSFIQINETSNPVLIKGFETTIFKLDHLVDTYGFALSYEGHGVDFAYVADTRWCKSVHDLLSHKPRVVLIDLNGRDDDPEPVHLSMNDLRQKAIPLTGEETAYYGTHLKEEFTSTISCVKCATPGMEIHL